MVTDHLPKCPSLEKTAGGIDDGGRVTWTVAYTIEGIRDWLFAQTK